MLPIHSHCSTHTTGDHSHQTALLPTEQHDLSPSTPHDSSPPTQTFSFSTCVLQWYDKHKRSLPWRLKSPHQEADPNRCPPFYDPYPIWISEIMLQQTGAETVKPYFMAFMHRFPTLHTLAAADVTAVLGLWQGLGYYTRAHQLHKCAQQLERAGGQFPQTAEELLRLPGIGPYTSSAIASIAFHQPIIAIDGNLRRILKRFLGLGLQVEKPAQNFQVHIPDPHPSSDAHTADTQRPCASDTPSLAVPWTAVSPAQTDASLHLEPFEIEAQITHFGNQVIPADRPGDLNEALMDIGATLCKPKQAQCVICPLRPACAVAQQTHKVVSAHPERSTWRAMTAPRVHNASGTTGMPASPHTKANATPNRTPPKPPEKRWIQVYIPLAHDQIWLVQNHTQRRFRGLWTLPSIELTPQFHPIAATPPMAPQNAEETIEPLPPQDPTHIAMPPPPSAMQSALPSSPALTATGHASSPSERRPPHQCKKMYTPLCIQLCTQLYQAQEQLFAPTTPSSNSASNTAPAPQAPNPLAQQWQNLLYTLWNHLWSHPPAHLPQTHTPPSAPASSAMHSATIPYLGRFTHALTHILYTADVFLCAAPHPHWQGQWVPLDHLLQYPIGGVPLQETDLADQNGKKAFGAPRTRSAKLFQQFQKYFSPSFPMPTLYKKALWLRELYRHQL